jgi:hypothetical protein
LCHDFPKQLDTFIRECDLSITVETLKEEVNALEEVKECLVVRHNTPCCLCVRILDVFAASDLGQDLLREEH